MTASFPLLKLPLIAQRAIIEQLDFLDLLQLSMKSSTIKRRLELWKLSVQTMNFLNNEKSYWISIMQNYNRSYIYAYDYVPKGTVTELANIQGEPVQIWNIRNGLRVKSDLSEVATLETITKYILSVCKVKKYTLTSSKTEIRNLFIWQITTQLDKLHISSSPSSSSSSTAPQLAKISPEDLVFILEEISVALLHISVDCPGFKYQRTIRHPAIYIHRPRWIDFDQFSLGAETITANFSHQKVSVDVLNRLIKDWTEGKNPKLREVLFKWKEYDGASWAMAQEHETRPPKPVLPNRNVEPLKGLCINHRMTHRFLSQSVYYEVRLSVEEDLGLNGIHLED